MPGNIFTTNNSFDSSFHTSEIFVVILLQSVCLGNGFIYLSIIRILILQCSNRIFDSLCHLVYFRLLRNVLVTDNSFDSGFHTSEIFVVILLQSIRLSNSLIDLGIVRILILQCSNCIFNFFRHCIYFALLGNVLVTHNGIHCRVYTGEVLVVILIQFIGLGNGCIDLVIVRILVLQVSNRIVNSICHCIHFALLGNVFITDNSIDSIFHSGEVLVVVLIQCFCLCFGNGCINLSVVSR